MRPRDRGQGQQLNDGLLVFHHERYPLPGITAGPRREAFVEQLLESIHRVQYISVISTREVSPLREDPSSVLFDPLKAAILKMRSNQIDEAFWLVFLSVHFGKNGRTGWRLTREIYGCLGGPTIWNWARTAADTRSFRIWLASHGKRFTGRFGNHRKYESLKASSARGTGAVIESYVRWIQLQGSHELLIDEARHRCNGDRRRMFDYLYNSMDSVMSFGRMAKFDYLTMVGKLGLAPIEPGSPYLCGATGPLAGARLLFSGKKTAPQNYRDLDARLIQMGADLNLGMQVLEDALCNWQKNPNRFIAFRG